MSSLPDAVDMRPHQVYRVFEGDTLLYIGCARDADERMSMHMEPSSQSATSWDIRMRMTRYEVEQYATKAEARQAERAAIASEAPLLNRQHNPSRYTKRGGLTFREVT